MAFSNPNSLPTCAIEYKDYMKNISRFTKSRNSRIDEWAKINLAQKLYLFIIFNPQAKRGAT